MELTYKQRLFVEAYLGESHGNASDAARRAGYGSPGIRGFELVQNRKIRAAIDARLADAAMPANEVLARLSEIAAADLGSFLEIDDQGGWKVKLRKGKTRLLKKIKPGEDGPEIEILNPMDALKQLGIYHGLFTGEAARGKTANRREVVTQAKERALDRKRNRNVDRSSG